MNPDPREISISGFPEDSPRLVRIRLMVFTPDGRIFLGDALPGDGMSQAEFASAALTVNTVLSLQCAKHEPARDLRSRAKLRARILDILPGLLESQGLRFDPPGEV